MVETTGERVMKRRLSVRRWTAAGRNPEKILDLEQPGRRRPGRPRTRWVDGKGVSRTSAAGWIGGNPDVEKHPALVESSISK